MANNVYCANLISGGAGALDAIDGAGLTDGDVAFVIDAVNNVSYIYTLNASIGGTATSPTLIAPVSNAGTKRWELVKGYAKDSVTLSDATNIGLMQFASNVLEIYNQRHGGSVALMVEDGSGNKETAVKATGGGAVELYHDNSKKVETTAAGATVTGDVTATGGVIASTGTFNAAPSDGVAGWGFRQNYIINGDTAIWQRGIASVNVTSGSGSVYLCDRFKLINNTDGTIQYAQSQTVPDARFIDSLLVQGNVADTSIATGQLAVLAYAVEGYDFRRFAGQTVTLSFYAYSNLTGTYCVSFRNYNSDRSYVVEYTISSANTWERKSVTLVANPAGTNNYTNNAGLTISWALAAGATYHTTAGAWQTGDYRSTSSQVNFLNSASNAFRITGIQLELGDTMSAFAVPDFATSLAQCQRYYEKSWDLLTAPGTATINGAILGARASGGGTISGKFCVRKRAGVAPTWYSPVTGTTGQVRNYNAGADNAASNSMTSETAFNVNAASASVDDVIGAHFTAESEL